MLFSCRIALLLILFAAAPCQGSVIGLWEFDDPPGTPLPLTTNSGILSSNMWSDNIQNSFTATSASGKGVYRVRRSGGTNPDGTLIGASSIVPTGTYLTGWARYTVVIDRFEFAGTGGASTGFQGEERIRFDLLDDLFPSTTARMVLQRIRNPADGSNQIFLSGEALSVTNSATNIAAVPIHNSAVSTTPLTLQLDVDFDLDTYNVSYAFGTDPLTSIGAGVIDPVRGLRYARISSFRKLDSTASEGIDIDSIRIEAVPEPGVTMLLLLGMLGMVSLHRRVQ